MLSPLLYGLIVIETANLDVVSRRPCAIKAWAASRDQSGEVERVTKKQVHQEANSSARGLKARFLDDPAVSQVRNPSGGQSKVFENGLCMLA